MNKKLLLSCFLLLFGVLVAFYFSINEPTAAINWQVRLPRFILTLVTGFVLGCVGFAFQILLNNPLAEPYILGISSGAALFSMIASLMGWLMLAPFFGFVGALITMFMVWRLANLGHYFTTTKLLLSGIIISLFFSACISLLMYFKQQDIGLIINILMGNLGRIFSENEFRVFLIVVGICLVFILYLFSKSSQLILLTLGDEVARSLGVSATSLRRTVFIIASFLTGVVVSYAGMIGFIGLLVPHIVRMLMKGYQNMIFSASLGAFLLLLCDLIAMNLTVIEIPVGIFTAFLGSPFFILLMIKKT